MAVYSGDNNFAGSQSDAQSGETVAVQGETLTLGTASVVGPAYGDGDFRGVATLSDTVSGLDGAAFTVKVNWGDGGDAEEFPFAAGASSFSVQHYYDPSTANGTDPYHATVTVTASDRRPPSNTDDIDIAGQSVVTVGVTATPYDPGSGEGGVFTFTRSDSHGAMREHVGGTRDVPARRWHKGGPVYLRSKQRLHVGDGAGRRGVRCEQSGVGGRGDRRSAAGLRHLRGRTGHRNDHRRVIDAVAGRWRDGPGYHFAQPLARRKFSADTGQLRYRRHGAEGRDYTIVEETTTGVTWSTDYSGTIWVTFPPGVNTATLDIIAQPATADFNDYDANHNVIGGSTERTVALMPLGGPGVSSGGAWNNWTEGPIQFDNADPPPVIVLQDSTPTVSIQETDTNQTVLAGQAANFTVSIPNAVDHDVAVFYNTVDGTVASALRPRTITARHTVG